MSHFLAFQFSKDSIECSISSPVIVPSTDNSRKGKYYVAYELEEQKEEDRWRRLDHVLRRTGDEDLAERAVGQPEGVVGGRQGAQAQLRADVAGTCIA